MDIQAFLTKNTGTKLDEYIKLTVQMLELDKYDNPKADEIRDRMDPIWYDLLPSERELLNSKLFKLVEEHNQELFGKTKTILNILF